jgi:predicted  nucleic acid-binding Zn-ribbon protein
MRQARVSELKASQVEIQRELDATERARSVEEWKRLRDVCRTAKDRLSDLRREFKQADSAVQSVTREIDKAQAALATHRGARPLPEDFPADEEIDQWEQKEQRLSEALRPLLARRSDLTHTREQLRLQLVRADQDFVQLQYAERNALKKAFPQKPGAAVNANGIVSL